MRTRPTGRTEHETAEVPPAACSNGHPFDRPRAMQVGFLPCICSMPAAGHRTYQCGVCGVVDFYPPHDRAKPPTVGSLYDD